MCDVKTDQIARLAMSSVQLIPILWYRKVKAKTFSSGVENYFQEDNPDGIPTGAPYLTSNATASDLDEIVSSMFETDEDDEDNDYDYEGSYQAIVAILSVINIESGLGLQVKSSDSNQTMLFLDQYEILDIDPEFDIAVTDAEHLVLERVVPLNIIHSATRGGAWAWHNITQLGSGRGNRSVKVNSFISQDRLDTTEKTFLFDVIPSEKRDGIERDDVIESINCLVQLNQNRKIQEKQETGCFCSPVFNAITNICGAREENQLNQPVYDFHSII